MVVSAADDDVATFILTFNQLIISQDWADALELESEMNAIVKTFESSNPRRAGIINLLLGSAHSEFSSNEMGREGGIEEATLYCQKSIELAKKAGDNHILTEGVFHLAKCYGMTGRVDEAMDLFKSLCDEIGKRVWTLRRYSSICCDPAGYPRHFASTHNPRRVFGSH